MLALNETHDVALTSWVDSANDPASDFPIQNQPFGALRRRDTSEPFRVGVAIGDQFVDLHASRDAGAFAGLAARAVAMSAARVGWMMSRVSNMKAIVSRM